MRLGNGKYVLVTVLVFMLLLNPVAGMAGAASSLPAAGAAPNSAAASNVFRQSASLLGTMFSGGYYAAAEPPEAEEAGLFDPLLDTVGDFFKVLLEDEEFKEVLGEVLDEIQADERIAGYDIDALVIRTLRDERLINILGSVIARHLGDKEFIAFVEQLTDDISNLLKDPAFVSYLHKTIISLLEDERVNGFVFEIVNHIMGYADQFTKKAGDGRLDAALTRLLDDLIALFEAPISKYADEILEDERVTTALDKILEGLDGLDEQFVDTLMADEDFNQAVEELLELFLDPLSGIPDQLIDQILNQDALNYLIEVLVEELTDFGGYSEETGLYEGPYEELFAVLELLQDDLDAVLTQIGAEANSVMAHYSEHGPLPEPGDDAGGGCLEEQIDISQVEGQVGDFLNYWAEVAAWVATKKIERGDLDPLIEKYLGEDSIHLVAIEEAVSEAAGTAQEGLLEKVDIVLEAHTADFQDNMMALLDLLLYGDPADEDDNGIAGDITDEFNRVLDEKLEEMKAGELLDLVEGRGDEVLEALMNLIAALPLDLGEAGSGNQTGGGDLSSMLNDIALELPFEVLADLIDEADIKELVDGLFKLVDDLPLDSVASYLRDNSDELGYTIADSLLNGIADGIEFPEPEDPREAAILELLKNEERMRRFYIDLGGQDPDKITAESTEASIIMEILLEVAGDQDRIERFSEELAKESELVVGDLLNYGKKLGDWLLGSVRSFVEPFIKRALASFLIFTPRGYDNEFKTDPAEWLSYDRFSSDAAVGGVLANEMITKSMLPRFIDESMFRFLVEHSTVEDFATPERLGVIQYFLAEITDAEPLKALRAGDGAANMLGVVEQSLHQLRAETLPGLIEPDQMTRDLNSLLSELLPGSPSEVFRFSIESLNLTAEQILAELAGPIDDATAALSKDIDGLAEPLANLPADLLDDTVLRKAKEDIIAETPEMAMELVAGIIEDEALGDLLADSVVTVVEELLDEALDVADDITQDPRLEEAIEEAVITVLADEELGEAIGDLAGDMLEDELLLDFVDDLLRASRIIAVGDYSCPPSNEYYKPGNFLGGTGQTHGFEGEPDLPAEFPFTTKNIKVPLGNLSADYFFFEMGCNNGLYMFADELLNWMDPGRPFPHQTPGSYLRDYLPNIYLTPQRVRDKVADPLAALIANTLKGLPEERDSIKQLTLEGIEQIFEQKPLQVMADYLRVDPKLSGILKDRLAALPYDDVERLLRNNEDIISLLKEAFDTLPLEEAGRYLYNSKLLKGLLKDAGVDIDFTPLRPLLRVDRELPQLLLQKAQAFPAERVTDFLMAKQHLYRVAYMTEDMTTRLFADLLTNPELIQLESDLAKEKVAAANYSLAEGICNVAGKFVGDSDLIDYVGNLIFDFIGEQYGRMKDFFRSLFLLGIPEGGTAEVLSPGPPARVGSSRDNGAFFKKEGA